MRKSFKIHFYCNLSCIVSEEEILIFNNFQNHLAPPLRLHDLRAKMEKVEFSHFHREMDAKFFRSQRPDKRCKF